MIQPCVRLPRRPSRGVSGALSRCGGGVGESAHEEDLVRREDHPSRTRKARQRNKRQSAPRGASRNPDAAKRAWEDALSRVTAANTCVAPPASKRRNASPTKRRPMPRRLIRESTATKYTY